MMEMEMKTDTDINTEIAKILVEKLDFIIDYRIRYDRNIELCQKFNAFTSKDAQEYAWCVFDIEDSQSAFECIKHFGIDITYEELNNIWIAELNGSITRNSDLNLAIAYVILDNKNKENNVEDTDS